MVIVVLLAVLILCVAVIAAGGGGGAPTKASRGVAVAALLVALLTAVPVFPLAWDDSGLGFALALSSLPIVLSAAGAAASWGTGIPGVVVGWVCVVVLCAYVVVLAPGAGFFFLPAALLLLASMLLRSRRHIVPRR